jgi:hypothetical protein
MAHAFRTFHLAEVGVVNSHGVSVVVGKVCDAPVCGSIVVVLAVGDEGIGIFNRLGVTGTGFRIVLLRYPEMPLRSAAMFTRPFQLTQFNLLNFAESAKIRGALPPVPDM